jgi:hypothetical protein
MSDEILIEASGLKRYDMSKSGTMIFVIIMKIMIKGNEKIKVHQLIN